MKLCQTTKEHVPALAALWHRVFGDSEEGIRDLLTRAPAGLRTYALLQEQTPLAALCIFPTELIDDSGESHPTAYLYALCTEPEARGRGLATRLLTGTERVLCAEFDYVTLTPASQALFDFYQKRGWETVFYHTTLSVPAAPAAAKITRLTPQDYRALREMQLYGDFISYDASYLALFESAGAFYRVETAQDVCCIAAEKRGEKLLCKETLPACPQAAALLAAHLGCVSAELCTVGDGAPFAMGKALGKDALPARAYLGIALN